MKNRFVSTLALALVCVVCLPSLAFAKSFQDKAKKGIEEASKYLKDSVDSTAEGIAKAQAYFDSYPWKGIIQENATSGVATLSDLRMNGSHQAIVVRPNQLVEGRVRCTLDRSKCSTFGVYRIVLGFASTGPQASFLKAIADESDESFYFSAPEQPGVYELRFRAVEKVLESHAFQHWKDENGSVPSSSTTIGVVIVK